MASLGEIDKHGREQTGLKATKRIVEKAALRLGEGRGDVNDSRGLVLSDHWLQRIRGRNYRFGLKFRWGTGKYGERCDHQQRNQPGV